MKIFMEIKKIYFILPLMFMYSCEVSERGGKNPPPSSCTTTTNLSYGSACTTDRGCTLAFTCPLQASSPVAKIFDILTQNTLLSQKLQATAEQLTITSITTVGEPALLQTAPGLVSKTWYSNTTGDVTLNCTNDNGQISCPAFGPVGSKFDIVGTLGNQDVTLHVTVIHDVSPMATTAADLTAGCGQHQSGSTYPGTTYQRIFDCSERVTSFAGIGQGGGTSADFTLGNPDPNWFLVACPVFGSGTTSQQCSWLSPVIEATNPVVGINTNGSTTDTTSPDLGPPNGATRLLWSGALNNSGHFNYWQANGTDGTGNANCNNAGKCAEYSSGSLTFRFNGIYDVISGGSPNNLPNACQMQLTANDNSFSGMTTAPFAWIIPSYPYILTLTGGSSCSYGSMNTNSFCNGLGFSATSTPVPSFDKSGFNSSLWSSSVRDSIGGDVWFFRSQDGDLSLYDPNDSFLVRCVSAAW